MTSQPFLMMPTILARNTTLQVHRMTACFPQLHQTSRKVHHRGAHQQRVNFSFVPKHKDPQLSDVTKLQQFVTDAHQMLILTGAGLSTESGIPDYRSKDVGLYSRTTRRPVEYHQFIKSAEARQRYWARNFVGWPQFSSVQPNAAHKVLSEWQRTEKILGLVTQNVDALHTKAGSKDVIELHGCTHRVRCLSCHTLSPRTELQSRFEELNPMWEIVNMPIAPDGDVHLDEEQVKGFQVPPCSSCGGALIPDVVFFGANVPRPRVEKVFNMVDMSDAVLVCGSSLHVYSGYRFVARAAEKKIPIAILNIGPTRADALAHLKIETLCGSILPDIRITPLGIS